MLRSIGKQIGKALQGNMPAKLEKAVAKAPAAMQKMSGAIAASTPALSGKSIGAAIAPAAMPSKAKAASPMQNRGRGSMPMQAQAAMKKGGSVGSASKRADGIAKRGKTKGTEIAMCGGGMYKGKK
jgi:hypothetical protein